MCQNRYNITAKIIKNNLIPIKTGDCYAAKGVKNRPFLFIFLQVLLVCSKIWETEFGNALFYALTHLPPDLSEPSPTKIKLRKGPLKKRDKQEMSKKSAADKKVSNMDAKRVLTLKKDNPALKLGRQPAGRKLQIHKN